MVLSTAIAVDIAVAPTGAVYIIDGRGHLWASTAAAPHTFAEVELPKPLHEDGRGARSIAIAPNGIVYVLSEKGRLWASRPDAAEFAEVVLPKPIDPLWRERAGVSAES